MTVRILQVGAGIRGRHWAQFISDYPEIECTGVVDPDSSALELIKGVMNDSQCSYFGDLDEALKKCELDAALIVTPSRLHAEQTIKCLRAGLTVMVEKPLATSVDDAKQMIAVSQETSKQVIVAENYRFFRAERTVKDALERGMIGTVDNAVMVDRRNMPSHTEGPWLAEAEYAQLQEIAIHHFDSLRGFFGKSPTSISLRVWNPDWTDYKHGTNTEALVDFEGIRSQYVGTLRSHRFGCSIWIEGENGTIWTDRKRVFWRPMKSRWFRPVRHSKVPPGDEKSYPRGGTTALLNSLRDAVLHNTEAETNARDNIWTVAMVEAGKLSDRERRNVEVSEVYRPAL